MIRHYLSSNNKICYSTKTNNFSLTKQSLKMERVISPVRSNTRSQPVPALWSSGQRLMHVRANVACWLLPTTSPPWGVESLSGNRERFRTQFVNYKYPKDQWKKAADSLFFSLNTCVHLHSRADLQHVISTGSDQLREEEEIVGNKQG